MALATVQSVLPFMIIYPSIYEQWALRQLALLGRPSPSVFLGREVWTERGSRYAISRP